ncbi:hypothetical protein BL241_11560 [Ralstonia solanacearum]|nr:hypothetical protein BL241_11560 [Ralstonia solanacearum]
MARLEAQLTEAEADLSRHRSEHETLLADAALDEQPLDASAIKKARDAAALDSERVSAVRAALATARARLSAAQQQESRAELAARWDKAVGVAAERHVIAQRLAKSAEQFAADYAALIEANSKLYAALPGSAPDPEAALMHNTLLETAVRMHLLKSGAGWAFSWPYGTVSLPDFREQNASALQVVRSWAPDKD